MGQQGQMGLMQAGPGGVFHDQISWKQEKVANLQQDLKNGIYNIQKELDGNATYLESSKSLHDEVKTDSEELKYHCETVLSLARRVECSLARCTLAFSG
jgi:hypothetical protein